MDFKAEWIAPNSKFFGKYNDGVPFFKFVLGGAGHTYPMDVKYVWYWRENPHVKSIAAAVAIEEWQTEIDRLEGETGKILMRENPSADDIIAIGNRQYDIDATINEIRNWRDKAAV